MKANVGSGDGGMTSLLSGERVPKSHERIEACGELDELSSVLGVLSAALSGQPAETVEEIRKIQEELLHIGAWLAMAPGSPPPGMPRAPSAAAVDALERSIDRMEKDLPPLQGFLLPGGHPSAAWAHVARTVARRAERRAAAVAPAGSAGAPLSSVLPFLNRLSTYLYALARRCNRDQGVAETLWTP
ncbi:MAG: cob(I)yrinic acid a,c-diamide adenosyltransferase [Spirochaetia bacterium]